MDLLNSYTEISPSGTGLHILVKSAPLQMERNRKGFLEIYHKGRYFTMMGNVYGRISGNSKTGRRSLKRFMPPFWSRLSLKAHKPPPLREQCRMIHIYRQALKKTGSFKTCGTAADRTETKARMIWP